MEFIFWTKSQTESLELYQKYACLSVFFNIFAQICSAVIYKSFWKFYELLFPRKPVAAANRCKVLKYSFP